jgi:hypothetical protein
MRGVFVQGRCGVIRRAFVDQKLLLRRALMVHVKEHETIRFGCHALSGET